MWAKLLELLGLASGTGLNKLIGGINYALLAGVLAWSVTHVKEIDELMNQELQFRTSVGFLLLMVGIAFLLLELARRSRPDA